MVFESSLTLLEFLGERQVLNAKQVEEVRAGMAGDAKVVLRNLVQRGWLTVYQANQLAQGNGPNLVLGQYLILDRLGEGGMGQVFKARHLLMNRLVALKVIHQKRLANADAVGRFRREIQAAAQLSHPNIIAALHADQVGPVHFLVMEYAAGADLAKVLKERGPLPIAAACAYLGQAALGLQHAHERGLVHRDIKPSNLLLIRSDGAGPEVIKILDMGLARLEVEGSLTAENLTQEGAVMGTPNYIAPEQAIDSHKVDIRADIYSLGCTLYHLLTGSPPFPGGSLAEKLLKHQNVTPPQIRQARPEIPQALADVVAKMLAKRPENRFATPAMVAAALAPFGADDPSPPTVTYAAQPAPKDKTLTLSPPSSSSSCGDATTAAKRSPRRRWQRPALAAGLTLAGLLLAWVLWPRDHGATIDPNPANGPDGKNFNAANPLPGHPPELVGVLGDERWRHGAAVQQIAYSGDGQLIASGSYHDKTIRVWDVATGKLRTLIAGPNGAAFAFAKDGRTLATAERSQAVVREVPSGKELSRLANPDIDYQDLAFLADGQTLAIKVRDKGIEKVQFWQPATEPNQVVSEAAIPGHLSNLILSEDKTWFLAMSKATNSANLYRLDASKDKSADLIYAAKDRIRGAAFSPDRQLIVASETNQVVFWDMKEKKERFSIPRQGDQDYVIGFAFSSDSQKLALGGSNKLQLWDLPTQQLLVNFQGPVQNCHCLAYAPDGQTLATGNDLGRIILWNVATGKEKHPTQGHSGPVTSLAFSRDGRLLASAGDKTGEAKIWDLAAQKEIHLKSQVGRVSAVAFAPDNQTLAMGDKEEGVMLWDLKLGRPRVDLKLGHANKCLAYSANGKLLAGGELSKGLTSMGGWAFLWDPTTEKELAKFSIPVTSLAMAPKEDLAAFGTWNGSVHLVSTSTPKDMKVLNANAGSTIMVASLAFHPADPGKLAAAHGTNIKIWDLEKKIAFPILDDHKETVVGLAFLQGGKKMLSADQGGHIYMWDTAAWARERELYKVPGLLHTMAVSADERLLATGNGNGSIYLLRLPD